jgi:triacylglycerol lipase
MTPIVLQHGLFGFGDFKIGKFKLSYFNGIDRAIAARGHPLIVCRVHPTGSIELRAKQLKVQIQQQLRAMKMPKSRVVIFGHSMGGLDARYMISELGMAERVAALVTVSTPHRGSPYADWCELNLGKRLGGTSLIRWAGLDLTAIADLTTRSCKQFNAEIHDSPDVKYFSISAARHWHQIPPFLLHSHKIVFDAEGANDGVVSVSSAKWGQHLETWRADHLHVVNKRLTIEIKNRTGDVSPRYLKILDRLTEDGCANCD